MAGICIIAAGVTAKLAVAAFTLSWTHTVEKSRWEERWRVDGDRLVLVEAAVEGSGAGMEPGPGAWRDGRVWRWRPVRPAQKEIVLAASGYGSWRLCVGEECREFGVHADDGSAIVLRACP